MGDYQLGWGFLKFTLKTVAMLMVSKETRQVN